MSRILRALTTTCDSLADYAEAIYKVLSLATFETNPDNLTITPARRFSQWIPQSRHDITVSLNKSPDIDVFDPRSMQLRHEHILDFSVGV